jgi:hypothetical protein
MIENEQIKVETDILAPDTHRSATGRKIMRRSFFRVDPNKNLDAIDTGRDADEVIANMRQ